MRIALALVGLVLGFVGMLVVLLASPAAGASPKPPGCVCSPPSVASCVQVSPDDRTPCGEKLRTCLDWCVAHPVAPAKPAPPAWKSVPPNCGVEYDSKSRIVGSWCTP